MEITSGDQNHVHRSNGGGSGSLSGPGKLGLRTEGKLGLLGNGEAVSEYVTTISGPLAPVAPRA